MLVATLIRPGGDNRLQVFKSEVPWCGSATCLIRADMSITTRSWSSPVCAGISSVVCWLVWSVCINLSTEGSTSYQCATQPMLAFNVEAEEIVFIKGYWRVA